MATYRIFRRPAWRKNPSWPNGYEPYSVPVDAARTIKEVKTIEEAISFCDRKNAKWRGWRNAVNQTSKRVQLYHEFHIFEWMEL